ncbi:MAG TPA: SDR family NAD(P)-dependent oxidoreductase [Acidimicrobiales bacterium]|nr:SDR family NAD(P)-dependent oxidoreductase [Acidimicrobiales bacterium]
MNGLTGKVAVVTGAAAGIGLATAERLAAEGARVAVVDLSDRADAVAEGLGPEAVGVRCDVASAEAVQAMVDTVVGHFGTVDILCNVAGVPAPYAFLADVELGDFQRMVDVNLSGTYHVMKFALPVLLRSGRAAIVNVSSTAGATGMAGLGPYSAAKAGIIALTRVAAAEYGTKGVRVNCVLPGLTRTPGNLAYYAQFDDPDAVLESVAAELGLLRRLAEPEEIAAAIAFLASDDASFITGPSSRWTAGSWPAPPPGPWTAPVKADGR